MKLRLISYRPQLTAPADEKEKGKKSNLVKNTERRKRKKRGRKDKMKE
jgi:hypothetical protein